MISRRYFFFVASVFFVLLCYFSFFAHETVPSVVDFVHIGLSADSSQWLPLVVCAHSALLNAADASRLLFHVFCTPEQCDELDQFVTLKLASQRHQFRFVHFDGADIARRFARTSRSSSAARNLSSPHNFVRFYMPQLLPRSVSKIIWLDNDVLVQGDVTTLFDQTFATPSTAQYGLAAVVQRRALEKSMIKRIFAGLEGKPFGKAASASEARPRSLDMSHARYLPQLLNRSTECRHTKQKCFHFNAGIVVLELNYWRDQNTTLAIEEWLRFLADNPAVAVGLTQPPLVFHFWENIQELERTWNWGAADDIASALDVDPTSLKDAALLHFNGDNKPWLTNHQAMRELWESYLPE